MVIAHGPHAFWQVPMQVFPVAMQQVVDQQHNTYQTMTPQPSKIVQTKKVAALSIPMFFLSVINGAACENRTRDTNLEGSGNTILRTPQYSNYTTNITVCLFVWQGR
jgi:hypothetical protein